jgi:hypothetical protein
MFVSAGFGEAVERARGGGEQSELLELLPAGASATLGLVGGLDDIRDRLRTYAEAGLDEIAVVPATVGDPSGTRTLTALTSLL